MRGKIILCVSLIISPALLFAGWQRVYGGCQEDLGYSVAQTSDGGYIAAGYTDSYSDGENEDFFLVRTDPDGDTIWTRTYGGDEADWAYSVAPTLDDGFIVVGRTYSYGSGSGDVYIVKTDADGDTVWTRTYGGTDLEEARYVNTAPGGYIVVGYTNSLGTTPGGYFDVYVLLLHENGDTILTRTYGGDHDDGCFAGACKTADGGYVITGKTNSFGPGDGDVYLVKISSSADLMWERAYGGSDNDEGWSVVETDDGGFAIAGFTSSSGAELEDVYIIKTNSTGDTLWTRTYGGDYYDRAYSIVKTDGGNLAVAGTKGFSTGGDWYDIWLLLLDNLSGDTLWTRTFGGEEDDLGFSVAATNDYGFVIAGYTNSPCFGACSVDVILIKTDSLGYTGIGETPSARPVNIAISTYPNPFNSAVRISVDCRGLINQTPTVEIYDINGRLVADIPVGTRHVVSLRNETVIWTPDESIGSGVYLVRVKGINAAAKVIYLK